MRLEVVGVRGGWCSGGGATRQHHTSTIDTTNIINVIEGGDDGEGGEKKGTIREESKSLHQERRVMWVTRVFLTLTHLVGIGRFKFQSRLTWPLI